MAGGLFAAMLWAVPAHAGLCGDTSGDGFLAATDALATLRLAVGGGYDRRGDVKPAGGDGKLSAGDSLETLRAAVEKRMLRCAGAGAARAVVTTAPDNFNNAGGLAVLDAETRSVRWRGGSISGDAVIRTPNGTPVVINREGTNSLQFLDLSKASLPNVKECSVSDGFNSNPQDVVFVSATKGYVTPYGGLVAGPSAGKKLFVIDPSVLFDTTKDPACNGLITGRVDLSSFDSDGFPQMDQMALVGSDLFVALQLLDDVNLLHPKQNGLVVVLDTNTDTVKGTIPLSFANPFSETKGLVYDEFQRLLFVSGPGHTGSVGANLVDGGIEAIDPAAMQSKGMILTGADLQANLFDLVVVGTRRAFAIVADAASNSVIELDLKERTKTRTLLSSTSLITDLEMTDSGELWVAYRGESKQDPAGIRIFDTVAGVESTAKAIPLGQAPFTIAFLP
jgi:hypothetical protein